MAKKTRDRTKNQIKDAIPADSAFARSSTWALGFLVLAILLTTAIRCRLIDIPLERDEGEYAYMGQLLLEGVPPYTQAYNMKLPGVATAYALFMSAFGQTVFGIHMGFSIWNVANILLVFMLGRWILDLETGAVAGAIYSLLALSAAIPGTSAHATHFVVLPALAGVLTLTAALERKRVWLFLISGFISGVAFMMKQQAAALILFSFFWLLWSRLRNRQAAQWRFAIESGALVFGTLIPYVGTCLILYFAGAFNSFWFWTFRYAREYVSNLTLAQGFDELTVTLSGMVGSMWALWVLAAAGMVSLWRDAKARKSAVFMLSFCFFSFLAVCPGLLFRPHYFVVCWPAVALLGGACISSGSRYFRIKRTGMISCLAPYLVLFAAGAVLLISDWSFFFKMSPEQACRKIYDFNPFPESRQIAEYVRTHSSPDDRIAVLGSEPQIYFYARRRSATGHIYTYGLMEEQPFASSMQEGMIREIEQAKPKYLIFVRIPSSWLVQPGSDLGILEWFKQYQEKYYRKVGVVDLLSLTETRFKWDAAAEDYQPNSDLFILVFQRKNA